jgi:hypothetical protein
MKPSSFLVASIVLSLVLVGITGCGSGVPGEVEKLVSERSDFAEPILLTLPKESKRDFYEKAKAGEVADCGGLMPDVVIDGRSFTADDLDPSVRRLLTQNEWATIDRVTYGCSNSTESSFLFYTDQFEARLTELNRAEDSDDRIQLQIAHRKVRSVDYTNRYEAERLGASVPFFAFTFSYILEPDLGALPQVEQTFEGKAKAYRDPGDGKWKLSNLSLEDRGIHEYEELLEKEYPSADR